jgi:hypothetical protein
MKHEMNRALSEPFEPTLVMQTEPARLRPSAQDSRNSPARGPTAFIRGALVIGAALAAAYVIAISLIRG